MRKYSGLFKRAQSWVLVAALMLSIMSPMGWLVSAETADPTDPLYEGNIVVNNYSLTEAEKTLIGSGFLIGGYHSFTYPNTEDELISVNTDEKSVLVESFEKTLGYRWEPVSVQIVVGDDVKETVTLDEDGKGYYTYGGNAFSVKVNYQVTVTVDEDVQKILLNAPAYLKQGLANLDALKDALGNLGILQQAMPYFHTMATGKLWIEMYGTQVPVTLLDPNPQEGKPHKNQHIIDAVLRMNAQMVKNDNKLNLTVLLEQYKAADNKVKFLVENAATIQEEAQKLYDDLTKLRQAPFFGLIDNLSAEEGALYYAARDAIGSNDVNSQGNGCLEVLRATLANPWDVATTKIVRDGLSDVEYLALNAMVAALNEVTDHSATAIKNPLVAATKTLQYNMSMYEVTVKVVLETANNATDDIDVSAVKTETVTLILADGATKAEILDAVEQNGIVERAKDAWRPTYVSGKFVKTTGELPDTLTEDIEYVITFSPEYYDVTFAYGETVRYPYGHLVSLKGHEDADKVYDYTVTNEGEDGQYYPQGSTFVVVGNAEVTRKEGKPYTSGTLFQILANNYLNATGTSILTSGAVFGDVVINVREPDNSNEIVKMVGDTLTVKPYPSSYEGLEWQPYSYELSTGFVGYFNGASSVDITQEFQTVRVTYRLSLTNLSDETVLTLINLPNVLELEAREQLAALGRIVAQEEGLKMMNPTILGVLAGLVRSNKLNEDKDTDAALKQCFETVLNSIQANCMGSEYLKLYEFASVYNQQTNKLRYYYENHAFVRAEIAKLSTYMTELLAAGTVVIGEGQDQQTVELTQQHKVDALAKLMRLSGLLSEAQIENYVSKLTGLQETMADINDNLTAPNAAINMSQQAVESGAFGALTSALQNAAEQKVVQTQSFATAPETKPYLSNSSISVTAINKVAINVTIKVEGGNTESVSSDAITIGEEVTAEVIEKLIASINAKLAAQGVNDRYYGKTYDAQQLLDLIGTTPTKAMDLEYYWYYKTFTVSVPGMNDQTVSLKNTEFALAPSTDSAYRYDYYINGVKAVANSYTLTLAELDQLIDGTLKITLTEVFILREDLITYVNNLNAAIGNDQMVFVLVEKDGEFSIVLRLEAAQAGALAGSVQGAAMGMVQGKYSYVGVGGEAMLANGMVHLQAIVDALLNSGFGTDTIIQMMDAKGNINHMQLDGNILSDKVLAQLGGKVLESTMQLGSSADQYTEVKFFVTLGSAPAQLTQVRNLLAGKLAPYFKVVCQDGKASVILTLPEKIYEAYLAVLLMTGEIDLSNVNDVDGKIALGFINDHLLPLFQGEVTLETFENTLSKFGYDVDLDAISGVPALYDMLTSFYTNAEITYDAKSGIIDGNLSIASLIEAMNVGVLADLIAEKETGLSVAAELKVENLGKQYQAIYADLRANGVLNKVGLTNDVAAKVKNLSGISVIVLLSDVEADLNFSKTTLLNLNGFTVTGDVKSTGNLIIVDTHIGDEKNGTVDGNLSGKISVVSGCYTQDVTSFIKEGYVQGEDGVVSNKFYNIVKDADGNVTVEIDAGILYTSSMPSIKSLAIDLVCDLLFNGYTTNYLALDGYTVYDITVEDLVGLYAASDRVNSAVEEVLSLVNSQDLSALINQVLDQVFDFTAISEAIANDEALFSYTMTTGAWDVQLVHVKDGNYISADLAAGNVIDRNLSIKVVGADSDKEKLIALFEELGRTVDADINIDINHGLDGKDIFLQIGADANVFVDFNNPNYAVMLSIIAADGLSASARADLIAGIKEYYATNNIAALRWAFNKLTTKQLITALKNFNTSDSIAAMIKRLGLADVVDNRVVELESVYDRIGKLLAAVVRKAGLVGGDRTLGSYLDANGVYGFERADIEKMLKKGLFGGYAAQVEVSISEVSFGIQLFDKDIVPLKPEFVDGNGTPTVLPSDKVAGSLVDTTNKYIFVDAVSEGITGAELQALLQFYANNADNIEVVLGVAADALVVNGTKVTATATNRISSDSAVVEYTIIIVGDANGDGRTDAGDMIRINRVLVEMDALTKEEELAADINFNGKVDIGDAVLAGEKYVDWDQYFSAYGAEETM